MNRKQFLILVAVLVVLGGAGLALFWQDIATYRASGARIGAKLLPALKMAEVEQVHLKDAQDEVTLVNKGGRWVVQGRGDYPANVQEISGLMVKLVDLKVTQSETVGASLFPRVDLVAPGKSTAKEGVGTLVEFTDKSGRALASLILGKKVLKKDPLNPLPNARDGVPAGRYIRISGSEDRVVVVSDPLNAAEAKPGRWLAKDFFKVELEAGRPIRDAGLADDEAKAVRGFRFLTEKPVLVLLNVGEAEIATAPGLVERIRAGYDHRHAIVDFLSAKIEMELGELDPEDAATFMEELGITQSGLERVIRLSYRLLGLISFLTAGPDEVRASGRRGRPTASPTAT